MCVCFDFPTLVLNNTMSQFWGLVVSPNKTYRKVVDESFKLSQACLDLSAPVGARVALKVNVDDNEHVLCILTAGTTDMSPLDVVFAEGAEIVFSVDGDHDVHLTGQFVTLYACTCVFVSCVCVSSFLNIPPPLLFCLFVCLFLSSLLCHLCPSSCTTLAFVSRGCRFCHRH